MRITSQDSPNASTSSLHKERSSIDVKDNGEKKDAKLTRRVSVAEGLNGNYDTDRERSKNGKESNTDRLHYIINEPSMRSLFREFLRSNFCEENMSFWLDVEDFKKKFNISSSASAVGGPRGVKATPGQAAMERHHEALINIAFVIYNTYLAPSSPCELNIDHGLRNELSKYLEDVVSNVLGKPFSGRIEPEHASSFNATQLQTMIRLYERIQNHVFRLMATDSVPKVSIISVLIFSLCKSDDPLCL